MYPESGRNRRIGRPHKALLKVGDWGGIRMVAKLLQWWQVSENLWESSDPGRQGTCVHRLQNLPLKHFFKGWWWCELGDQLAEEGKPDQRSALILKPCTDLH